MLYRAPTFESDQAALLLRRVIEAFPDGEVLVEDLFFRKNPSLRVFVMLNDTFDYATADLEEITWENIEVFEQAITDGDLDGPLLFAVRVRKAMPLREIVDRCEPHIQELLRAAVAEL